MVKKEECQNIIVQFEIPALGSNNVDFCFYPLISISDFITTKGYENKAEI